MLIWLMVQKKAYIGCCLLPSSPAAHKVDPLNQQIGARRVGGKLRSEYSVEVLLCLGVFSLVDEDPNQTLQIYQRFLVLFSFFARNSQGFAVHRFRLGPLAFGFERQSKLAQSIH